MRVRVRVRVRDSSVLMVALFGGYCATIQGLLGRFEVENVLAKLLFYLNWCAYGSPLL